MLPNARTAVVRAMCWLNATECLAEATLEGYFKKMTYGNTLNGVGHFIMSFLKKQYRMTF